MAKNLANFSKTKQSIMSSEGELHLEVLKIKKAVLALRIINHLLRQQILQFIHENTRVTVTNIHTKFRIEQSVASEHLALLRRENFVITERHGRFIFYSVNYDRLKEVQALCEQLLKNGNHANHIKVARP